MSSPLNVIFAGAPEFAAGHLQALLDANINVVAVYTQPDRPAGRGKKLTPTPVKALAAAHDIPVHQPTSLKGEDELATLKQYQADIMVVVAYGLLLPQSVLDAFPKGCINVHASLLPRWRGAAPIQRCIEAGDTETGVGIMQMEAGLDTGPVLREVRFEIGEQETGGELHDRLLASGKTALIAALSDIADGKAVATAQSSEGVTYAHKLDKAAAKLDFTRPATALSNQVRAFNPWPVCHTNLGDKVLRVWQASVVTCEQVGEPGDIVQLNKTQAIVQCGEGHLALEVVQLPGKKAMPVRDLLNSNNAPLALGMKFS
ncbi:methionyl-tRNA formyltransferase [Salinibius halmophilus]|uniref:methionyl-tRNA formyltransferase n=1 Tax=Salinibius halmophilus TaxID=1853216 RepID=UPI000E66EF67|nr:methionyl-tRNA formyltransferase [Salinibius halmophilus]